MLDSRHHSALSSASSKIKFAIAVHHIAFVPYSVTADCSLTGNTRTLLPVLCCLWLRFDPGIFPKNTIGD